VCINYFELHQRDHNTDVRQTSTPKKGGRSKVVQGAKVASRCQPELAASVFQLAHGKNEDKDRKENLLIYTAIAPVADMGSGGTFELSPILPLVGQSSAGAGGSNTRARSNTSVFPIEGPDMQGLQLPMPQPNPQQEQQAESELQKQHRLRQLQQVQEIRQELRKEGRHTEEWICALTTEQLLIEGHRLRQLCIQEPSSQFPQPQGQSSSVPEEVPIIQDLLYRKSYLLEGDRTGRSANWLRDLLFSIRTIDELIFKRQQHQHQGTWTEPAQLSQTKVPVSNQLMQLHRELNAAEERELQLQNPQSLPQEAWG
jgi:hypothetical protein